MRSLPALALLGLTACAPKISQSSIQPDFQYVSDDEMEAEIAAEENAKKIAKENQEREERKAVELETARVTANVQDRCGIPLKFIPGTQYGHPSAAAAYTAATTKDVTCVYEVAREEYCQVELLPIASLPVKTPSATGSVVCTGWDGTRWDANGNQIIEVGF